MKAGKMFRNHYQGGQFVEIFSAQGKNPGAKWKIFGNPSAISKEYDKELKGFVFVLEGNSLINKMKLPRETKQTLGLVQQFLTLQIFVPLGKDFSTELLITDFDNIKRRLYLSTVHKELSVTPLHAKIPLFMIKRKIWCNMCIDLVTFTYEIFRGALFRSLDGIIISANCKLRKVFTLKFKPQNTAEEDGTCIATPGPYEASDNIPPTCQLNSDVPQVTQVLDLNEIHKPKIKCRENALQETGILGNRGNMCNSKTQDVSHIAFGSKILGPPPSSNRRTNAKVPGKVTKTLGSKTSCQLQNSGMPTETIPEIERLELPLWPCNDTLDQGGKRSTLQTTANEYQNDPEIQTQKTSVSGEADFQLTSPQVPSPDKDSHIRLSLKNAAKPTWEITNDKWVFPERFTESIQLDRKEHLGATGSSACCNSPSAQSASVEHHRRETADHQRSKKDVFTFSSKPRSAPYGKSLNVSRESYVFPLELELDSNREHEQTRTEDSFEGTDSSEEDDNSELIQSTENIENSHSKQGTSDSAVFKEIPLNKMSQRNEYSKNKEHSKYNFEEAILSKSQSSTTRKTESISFQRTLKPILSLSPIQSKSKSFRVIRNVSELTERYERVSDQFERSVSKTSLKKVSNGNSCLTAQTCEYDRKKYQSNRLSSSELQTLASMKRQQNEELWDAGVSHGLSAAQIDCCNVNLNIGDDDTANWNSRFPPPVSQEHHYQKEMSPLSHSSPRDCLNVFSPPIIPGSQQLEENTKSSTKERTPDTQKTPL
ncbi:protein CFAP20DC isoform X1 [Vidua macroura]|uniref:protein CFAP20DC isoform X1 n=1 Tax=Vidua macroura TaxID=187451 RepID=UPI0023A8B64A|nr:protein CFAP20DC isoform X1 [Vidua macroura]XP_053845293.1 protein CFAP20DC isoform X1 [Vidua macroura]XP_053845294.1 protein CFAP20DC isoform X1 [Vidua macroura]XP_053845295.1 protein CFAP20DC isoform X1 [Vidua macroura]XP_053845296.1 protein CFAP20DC isoform X1 [Vidua macroura]